MRSHQNSYSDDLPFVLIFSVKPLWEANGHLTSEFYGAFIFPSSEMHSFCNLMASGFLKMPYSSRTITLKAPEITE